jgi:hypothetical protein
MKQFATLLLREVAEWRLLLIVVGILYVLGLAGSAVGINRLANELVKESAEIKLNVHLDRDDSVWDEDDWAEDDWEYDDDEWLSPRDFMNFGWPAHVLLKGREGLLLYVWAHMLRGGLTAINLSLVFLALFYLVDSLYKERADRSTFFYRSLPVSDNALLFSKLVVGTTGFLLLSYLLGVIWVLFSRLVFPAEFSHLLEGNGLSLSQMALLDLVGDWFAFHLLQFLWLLPYALYLMFISAIVRSRPLLIALGAPFLLALLLRYSIGTVEPLAVLLSNLHALGAVLLGEWRGGPPQALRPGETLELFGGFGAYILSARTFISILAAAGLAVGTRLAYRRNFSTS